MIKCNYGKCIYGKSIMANVTEPVLTTERLMQIIK